MSELEQADVSRNGPAEVPDARAGRVVIRGVQAIVLDDLPREMQTEVVEAVKAIVGTRLNEQEVWYAVAVESGNYAAAIESYAGKSGSPGCKPGMFKALPRASWFASPLVNEPPLS